MKCEKFYLGYDIAGLKLFKFRRGETEYGIGILPLGGYVKMLGQEDNPARLREEIERAKQPAADADSAKPPVPSAAEVEAARQALFNPRSYLAKSVPRRMAIISAGVVMNLIFAWIMAIVAVRYFGVKEPAGRDRPTHARRRRLAGRPARGRRNPRSRGPARPNLPGHARGRRHGRRARRASRLLVRRPGAKNSCTPKSRRRRPTACPASASFRPATLKLYERRKIATLAGSPAAETDPPLLPGDKIVKLDDQPVHTHAEFRAYLRNHADKPVRVTVQRTLPPEKGGQPDEPRNRTASPSALRPIPCAGSDWSWKWGRSPPFRPIRRPRRRASEPGRRPPHHRRQARRRSRDPARSVPRPPGANREIGHRDPREESGSC